MTDYDAWCDEQDSIGNDLALRDECPAGGEHTREDNADTWVGVGPMPSPGYHCAECGASPTASPTNRKR